MTEGGEDGASADPAPGPSLGFGGCRFDFHCDAEAAAALKAVIGVHLKPPPEALQVARVRCVLSWPGTLGRGRELYTPPGAAQRSEPEAARQIRWRLAPEGLAARVGETRLEVRRSPEDFFVAAQAAAGEPALGAVLQAAAVGVARLQGGLLLHAAAVNLAGRAIAFIGPSGAGKTTACQHVGGSTLLSADRLLVAPIPGGGFAAHAYPGGERPEPDMPDSPESSLPLAAVVGVARASGQTRLEPLGGAAGFAALRAAVVDGGRGARAEESSLVAVEVLRRAVKVGKLHLRRGASLEGLLGRWNEG